jgi:hypothetical protein
VFVVLGRLECDLAGREHVLEGAQMQRLAVGKHPVEIENYA